jgi:ribosomal protein S8
MSLNERFRIDELLKKGSTAIARDAVDGIVVRRVDNTEVKPTNVKVEKPFGSEPIRDTQSEPKLKSDLSVAPTPQNVEQTSFAGETSAYLEKPYYDSEQLEKAKNIKVDELIKPKPEQRERYIKYVKYQEKLDEISILTDEKIELELENGRLTSRIAGLETTILSLQSDVISAQERARAIESEFESLRNRYESLLNDFQNAVLKGTKEGIERVSLTAQVRGLGAQKETLASQLESEKGIVNSLQDANKTLQQTIASNQKIAEQQIEAANQQVQAAQATASSAANSKKKKIICDLLYRQGYLPKHIWEADQKFGQLMMRENTKGLLGYLIWAGPVVDFLTKKPQYSKYFYLITKPWSEHMAYMMGVLPNDNKFGKVIHTIGNQFSLLVYNLYKFKSKYKIQYLNGN